MKTRHLPILVLIAALGASGGWFAARRWPATSTVPSGARSTARRILYYQSPMHPWIKSDKPGRCTICGMELTPVYEGEKGFESGDGIVTLGSNVIQVIGVQSEEVRRQPLRRQFRFAGTIDDNDARHRIVSAYVDGRVDQLGVNFVGAEVVASQPLATFYSPMLLAAEREYVAMARAAHPGGGANAEAEHQRLISSAAQRLKRYGLTDAQIAALPAKDPAELHSAIAAPVTGTVTARFVYEGQYVKEGDKLFEIADFATMWFLFDAYERDLAWLKPGQTVTVTTPALPGQSFTGAVSFIDPNLKEMSRSAKVRVELLNPLVEGASPPRRLLYHKLYAEAVVQVDIPEVLAVTRTAVLSPGAQPIAYIDKGGGAYEPRQLRLGRSGDEAWEVLSGLAEGERVVTAGNLLIDAQAQLNQNAQAGAAPPRTPSVPPSGPGLNDSQRKAIRNFLASVSALGGALAADDLAAFNRVAGEVHTAMPALLTAFDLEKAWQPLLERIEGSGHLEKAGDLAAARKAFLPFSAAVTDFAARLRAQPGFQSVKIYQCPMVDRAVPGAPKSGQWLQLQEPLRNPYFGAEMIDCGAEVK